MYRRRRGVLAALAAMLAVATFVTWPYPGLGNDPTKEQSPADGNENRPPE
jgi:hypothetical protein